MISKSLVLEGETHKKDGQTISSMLLCPVTLWIPEPHQPVHSGGLML